MINGCRWVDRYKSCGYRWLPVTNSNILHRGIVSRTGSNDREAYHVGYKERTIDIHTCHVCVFLWNGHSWKAVASYYRLPVIRLNLVSGMTPLLRLSNMKPHVISLIDNTPFGINMMKTSVLPLQSLGSINFLIPSTQLVAVILKRKLSCPCTWNEPLLGGSSGQTVSEHSATANCV